MCWALASKDDAIKLDGKYQLRICERNALQKDVVLTALIAPGV